MITKAVISLLLTNTALQAIVGTRIYPNIIKNGSAYPALYVSTDSMEELPCDDPDGNYSGKIEIVVFAESYERAHTAIKTIRQQLDNFSGSSAGVSISILSGAEVPDDWENEKEHHIKSIEYDAFAKINL